MDLQEDLKEKAISLGLCEQWTKEWGNPNQIELIEKYIRGIDFCIKNNYPSNEYIVRHFNEELLHLKGVYVSEEINENSPSMLIANGECTGTVEYNGFISRDAYVRHTSHLKIVIKDNARVAIRLYDNACIDVVNLGIHPIFVYQYGGHITSEGSVVIRQKEVDK